MAPIVSVIMPVYNVEKYVAQAIRSVLEQSFADFELIIIDDGGTDGSMEICRAVVDHRIRILTQANRGLAGARNTGIAAARGQFVALLDSDDSMHPEKLMRHVMHLYARPEVGVSYAGADLIDGAGRPLGIVQQPKLGRVTAADVFCGRVILNGSIPVFRRETLEEASYILPDETRRWYFDETLRRSEDIEFWTRVALTTRWSFAGIPGRFTDYRINMSGLSADVIRQLESWDQVCTRIKSYAPEFIARYGQQARALELRYLARRSFQMRDRGLAVGLIVNAISAAPRLVGLEPVKTLTTLIGCILLRTLPDRCFSALLRFAKPSMA
jgi:glycosyltransferase involved in cell wall biosynthesis